MTYCVCKSMYGNVKCFKPIKYMNDTFDINYEILSMYSFNVRLLSRNEFVFLVLTHYNNFNLQIYISKDLLPDLVCSAMIPPPTITPPPTST